MSNSEKPPRRFTPEELAACPCPDPFGLYIGFKEDCPLHGTKTSHDGVVDIDLEKEIDK